MILSLVASLLWVATGLVYANFLEWMVHRYVLHSRRRGLRWFREFHFAEHHRISRKNSGVDADYLNRPWSRTRIKEVVSLVGLGVLHLPLWLVLPWLAVGATIGTALYYGIHARAHSHPGWARTWVPWHLDHHLGRDQNKNWNVSFPLFDHLFGTRVFSHREL